MWENEVVHGITHLVVTMAKAERHDIAPESFEIRRMKNRWGCCASEGRILLNPDLIITPKKSIEYMIVHEMCQLK